MSFTEDYAQLQLKIPRIGMIQLINTNSDYCYNADRCKNCYMLANTVNNEDCMYGRDFYHNKDCVDCDHIFKCTLCYESINCKNCYDCNYLQDCENSSNCEYGYDLRGCKDCFGCSSLRQKQFCIFNKQYSQDEYEKLLPEAKKTHQKSEENFEKVKLETPRVYCVQRNSENFFGNYIDHSKNAYHAFDVVECEDIAYTAEAKSLKDCCDIFVLEYSELCYNISSCHKMYNCNCCFYSAESKNCEYSELLFNCENCFGCIALHHKKYHILNQPYEPEEYFRKVAEIKKELLSQNLYGILTIPPTYPQEDTVENWTTM